MSGRLDTDNLSGLLDEWRILLQGTQVLTNFVIHPAACQLS
ncbi:MAG: hypothetical protein AB1511_10415 [Deinococcota bacterium]